MPAAREPGPLVTRCRSRTVANVDSMLILSRRRHRGRDLVFCVVDASVTGPVVSSWGGLWDLVVMRLPGVSHPLIAEGLGKCGAQLIVVGFEFTDALLGQGKTLP